MPICAVCGNWERRGVVTCGVCGATMPPPGRPAHAAKTRPSFREPRGLVKRLWESDRVIEVLVGISVGAPVLVGVIAAVRGAPLGAALAAAVLGGAVAVAMGFTLGMTAWGVYGDDGADDDPDPPAFVLLTPLAIGIAAAVLTLDGRWLAVGVALPAMFVGFLLAAILPDFRAAGPPGSEVRWLAFVIELSTPPVTVVAAMLLALQVT